jgi:ParB family transcriptional regulator, chromosome partitioning protein
LSNLYISNELRGMLEDVDIGRIRRPFIQLRTSGSGLEDLVSSIGEKGLLQPIIVRVKEEHYEIVAGNRRYEACKNLRWKKMPCHIVEVDDKEAFEISIVENVQRETLSSIEEGEAFRKYVADFGWGGVSELAARMGKSVSYVTKRIKLLDLPTDVIDSIINRTISVSVAEELLFVKDSSKQVRLAELISKRHLSLRKTRNMIKDTHNGSDSLNGDDDNDNRYYGIESGGRSGIEGELQREERLLDKSITTLRIAMNRLIVIIESSEDNWELYNILMQQKTALHSQIDQLIKIKRKYLHIKQR